MEWVEIPAFPDTGEAGKRFQTYLFFVRHLVRLITRGSDWEQGLDQVLSTLCQDQQPLIANIQAIKLTDSEKTNIRKFLFNAWTSEAVARLASTFNADVKAITNQWKPIQCYYAIYFLLVPLHFTQSKTIPRSHERTLRFAADSMAHMLPKPWNFIYDFDRGQFRNCSPTAAGPVPHSWNLSNWDPEAWVCSFLRTTGVDKREERWQNNYKRKKHDSGDRKGKYWLKKEIPVGTVSVFDALARMRKWVNYKEAESILEGPSYEPHVEEFDHSLTVIVGTTLLVLERALARRVGRQEMLTLYADFIGAIGDKLDCGYLEQRRDLC